MIFLYSLAFDMLESLVIFLSIGLLSLLLPTKWIKQRFLIHSSVTVFFLYMLFAAHSEG